MVCNFSADTLREKRCREVKEIRTGQRPCYLLDGLVQAMQAAATLPVDLDDDIEDDVALADAERIAARRRR